MRHTVCKDCADRVLHCKSWCERWAKEKEQAETERKKMEKRKRLQVDLAELGKSREKRFRK